MVHDLAGSPRIVYRLRFSPQSRRLHVLMGIAGGAGAAVELWMPTWTPGSYTLREYARHVISLEARWHAGGGPAPPSAVGHGTAVAAPKVAKNRWRLAATAPGGCLWVAYSLYAHELSVRTNHCGESFALVVGAATFLACAGRETEPHLVDVRPCEPYAEVLVALPAVAPAVATDDAPPATAGRGVHVAATYAALIDAPILAGRPRTIAFTAAGRRHRLATVVDGVGWDERRAAAEVARIVEAHVKVFADIPYQDYLLLNLLVGGGGGLEHANSAVVAGGPHVQRSRRETVAWWGLVSHELFHAWNVKRLVPRALAGPDLEREAYTESLWIAEGITAYYDDLQVCRAGLSRPEEYLERLGRTLGQVMGAPGAGVQSLAAASFDAWTKFYRPTEDSDNTQISYYAKGCAVAFQLDMALRRHSGEAANLDTLMQLAWQRLAGPQGYDESAFRALAGEVAGVDMGPFFAAHVDAPGPLDLEPALATVGLELVPLPPPGPPEAPAAGWLGATTRQEGSTVWVARVTTLGPAEMAGLFPGDELVALDAHRVTAATLAARLAEQPPGAAFSLLVARRGRLLRLPVSLAPPRPGAWRLQVNPAADQAAHGARRRWLWGAAD